MTENRTIDGLIRAQAELFPHGAALCAPDGRAAMTYRELSELIVRITEFLRSKGIGRNDCLAVVLPNGPELAAAFLCVAAAAVCAPLNPSSRDSELRFDFTDLQVKGLIALAGEFDTARAVACELQIPIFDLQPVEDGPAGAFVLDSDVHRDSVPHESAKPEDVALVLHTSGTTARPKIVPLSHRNLCRSAENIRTTLQLTPTDRCLNVMPLFHIHGLIGACLSSLCAGGSVVCCPPFDAGRFFNWWQSVDPTWYTAVPTIHQAVLAQWHRQDQKPVRSRLRLIRSSSSALPPVVMQQLESVFGVPVLESYGMTEASHQMASNPLPPRPRKAGSVGLPAGPDMAIMNEAGELQPAGTIGELVIRGENVTVGYLNNPAANSAAFTHGWFRTGDHGWQDEDGYFVLTGRLKELVNRGGEKIAPREVDDALLEYPGVAQAVSFAVPHPRLGEDLATAVVLRSNTAVSEAELRGFALSRLTLSKVPSRILFVDDIPKGGTGKVQRIGLYEKLKDRFIPEYEPPTGEAEPAIADLWREVLDRAQIGAYDNFFFLGGDSLLAGRLVSRIVATFDVEFSLQDMFQCPTIRDQAQVIELRLIDLISRSTE